MVIGIIVALLLCLVDRSLLRGARETVSGHGAVRIISRNNPFSITKQPGNTRGWPVHHRVGLAPLLLDYPGVMVGVTGVIIGLSDRHALAELHERV